MIVLGLGLIAASSAFSIWYIVKHWDSLSHVKVTVEKKDITEYPEFTLFSEEESEYRDEQERMLDTENINNYVDDLMK